MPRRIAFLPEQALKFLLKIERNVDAQDQVKHKRYFRKNRNINLNSFLKGIHSMKHIMSL